MKKSKITDNQNLIMYNMKNKNICRNNKGNEGCKNV